MPTKNRSAKKKKTSLFARLRLKNPKARLLAFVLVFALLGGGVMVYRSFALADAIHTTETWEFSADTSFAVVGDKECGSIGPRYLKDEAKNGATVARLYCDPPPPGANSIWNVLGMINGDDKWYHDGLGVLAKVKKDLVKGRHYRMCAWVMYEGGKGQARRGDTWYTTIAFTRPVSGEWEWLDVVSNQGYINICSRWEHKTSNEVHTADLRIHTVGPGSFRVRSVTLLEGTKTPSPNTSPNTPVDGSGKNTPPPQNLAPIADDGKNP